MSKILDKYSKSPFAKLGQKISQMQEINIPHAGEIEKPKLINLEDEPFPVLGNQKTIDLTKQKIASLNTTTSKPLEGSKTQELIIPNVSNDELIKSAIQSVIVKPYGTILSLNSKFGNIFVKPFESLTKLFDIVGEPKPVILSNEPKLVNSPIEKIVESVGESKLLILNSNYDDLQKPTITSVLSFNIPGLGSMSTTSVESSKIPSTDPMIETSVLSSNLAKTEPMLETSVLSSNLAKTEEMPKTSVLSSDLAKPEPMSTTSVLSSNLAKTEEMPKTSVLSSDLAKPEPMSTTSVLSSNLAKTETMPETSVLSSNLAKPVPMTETSVLSSNLAKTEEMPKTSVLSSDLAKPEPMSKTSVLSSDLAKTKEMPKTSVLSSDLAKTTAIPETSVLSSNLAKTEEMPKTSVLSSDLAITTTMPETSVLSSNLATINTMPETSVLSSNLAITGVIPKTSVLSSDLAKPKPMSETSVLSSNLAKTGVMPETSVLSSNLAKTGVMPETSVLSFKTPGTSLIPITSVLSFKLPGTRLIPTTSVLSFKSPGTGLIPITSVLSFDLPITNDLPFTSVLLHSSPFGKVLDMTTSTVLKFFQSIVRFQTLSILVQDSSYSRIREYKTASVLTVDKSVIGNLIIPDIKSAIMVQFDKSGLVQSIPVPVNFIPDINATGFTMDAPSEITQFNIATVPPRNQPEGFTENASLGSTGLAGDVSKLAPILNTTPYISNKFVIDAPSKITDYNIDKIEADILTSNINTSKQVDAYSNFGVSNISTFATPEDRGQIQAFDFKTRKGVINEYANFYPDNISSNAANSNLSFTTFVDYQVRKMIGVSISRPNEFKTPLVALRNDTTKVGGNRFYYSLPIEYRGYNEASEILPSIANSFIDSLIGGAAALVGGALNSLAFAGLQSLLGVDFQPLKVSATGIAVVTGNMYYKMNSLDTGIKGVVTAAGTTGGLGLLGAISRTVISLGSAFLPSDVFKGDLEKYALMVAQILAGTKYTAAYAFYDATTKQYSSKYSAVGSNAVNWYSNDGTQAQFNPDSIKYGASPGGELPDVSTNSISGPKTPPTIDAGFRLSIYQRFLSANKGSSGGGVKTPDTKGNPLLGKEYKGLNVPSIIKDDSFTFGTFADFFNDSYWPDQSKIKGGPIGENKNGGATPTSPKSLYINYVESDKNTISNFTDTPSLDSKLTGVLKPVMDINAGVPLPTTSPSMTYPKGGYTDKLKLKLVSSKIKNTTVNLGIPDIQENGYVDTKNASELLHLDKNAEDLGQIQNFKDKDLIDFFFEDVTSDTKGGSILIPFRAIISSYSDSTSADWQTNTYVGRPDKFYIYGGFDRRVSISFEIAINSKAELLSSWRKINYLQGMCYPTAYPGNVSMTAPIMAVTIGALLQRVFVVMNSISLDFDASTIWEIEKSSVENFQLPMNIKIGVDFNVLFDSAPIANAKHFAQGEDWVLPGGSPLLYQYTNTNDSLKSIQSDSQRKRTMRINPKDGKQLIKSA